MDKIDIRDLRVGNWVKIKDLKDPIKRISGIDDYCGKVDFYDGEKLIVTSINNVLPIPLTEEILDKNEFKYKEFPKFEVNEITEKTDIAITYHPGSKTIFIGISEPNFNLTSSLVLYVHEMQNILRDARIEKEITI